MNKGKFAVRCLHCGATRMTTRRELDRAARVRCLMCGGPTEMSHQGSKRQAEAQTARDEQEATMRRKRMGG